MNLKHLPPPWFSSINSALNSYFDRKLDRIRIVGGTSITQTVGLIAQGQQLWRSRRPMVIVFPTESSAALWEKSCRFFGLNMAANALPHFDVSPYSGIFPSPRVSSGRVAWCHQAARAEGPEIFLAPVLALLQKTIPFNILNTHQMPLAAGLNLPSDWRSRVEAWGYRSSSWVEDVGTFASRGGIVDLFAPHWDLPIRLELVGNEIESLRHFDPASQLTLGPIDKATLIPAREVLLNEDNQQRVAMAGQKFFRSLRAQDFLGDRFTPGSEFLIGSYYDEVVSPLDHFNVEIDLWLFDPEGCLQEWDQFLNARKQEQSAANEMDFDFNSMLCGFDCFKPTHERRILTVENLLINDEDIDLFSSQIPSESIDYPSSTLREFIERCRTLSSDPLELGAYIADKIKVWRADGHHVIVGSEFQHMTVKVKELLTRNDIICKTVVATDWDWSRVAREQSEAPNVIHFVERSFADSFRAKNAHVIFLRAEDLGGRSSSRRQARNDQKEFQKQAQALSFGDLNAGDLVVHKMHGVGVYEGLKLMSVGGTDSEFLQISYKDGDKLYLPVFRVHLIQKFGSGDEQRMLDRLGGSSWTRAQTKVKKALRDLATDLLSIYAQRRSATRPAFPAHDSDFYKFENAFPYPETDDQLRAIQDVLDDMQKDFPMDRLICGDVGFGKTEVAMRAAFKAVQGGRQVALIAPTTILTFQHFESFKKRFKNWPINIGVLNRFLNSQEIKKTLNGLKAGTVDIVIGTHRLLSRDVGFKNLGLLIVDEEQKFGVLHKERLRKLRADIDTLAMSATPIPRTLNLSLTGIRDLSLINTPPVDRLPIRTLISKFHPEVIQKAVDNEIKRGGQVFILHNRVQSIYALEAELKPYLSHVRMAVAHGQLPEDELEQIIVKFYNHELDVLLCTTIIESGIDIPNANTMIIDRAHTLGLSQLYQLRGRVGRSRERAYCYLLVPPNRDLDKIAQERLKVLQDNTALGSGIRIAQYDLELRGSGDILGHSQSGHLQAVGYEMFMELLDDAIREQRGDPPRDDLEPEINLKVPAFIPDQYVPDVRIRLSLYKSFTTLNDETDLDRMEEQLRDQFGPPPEPVINFLGLMLIRQQCLKLRIREVSSGAKYVSLSFDPSTQLKPEEVLRLTRRPDKKYQLTPDSRLNIRINELSWPRVHQELGELLRLVP